MGDLTSDRHAYYKHMCTIHKYTDTSAHTTYTNTPCTHTQIHICLNTQKHRYAYMHIWYIYTWHTNIQPYTHSMRTYRYTHVYTCAHTTQAHRWKNTCTHVHTNTCAYICTNMQMHWIHTYVHTGPCMYIYTCICLPIWIYHTYAQHKYKYTGLVLTHMHSVHTYICTLSIHTYTWHTAVLTCTHKHVHMHTHMHILTDTPACMHMQICTCVYMYTCY